MPVCSWKIIAGYIVFTWWTLCFSREKNPTNGINIVFWEKKHISIRVCLGHSRHKDFWMYTVYDRGECTGIPQICINSLIASLPPYCIICWPSGETIFLNKIDCLWIKCLYLFVLSYMHDFFHIEILCSIHLFLTNIYIYSQISCHVSKPCINHLIQFPAKRSIHYLNIFNCFEQCINKWKLFVICNYF